MPLLPAYWPPADPTAALPSCPERTRGPSPTAPPSRVDKETQAEEPLYDDTSDLSIVIKHTTVGEQQIYDPAIDTQERGSAVTGYESVAGFASSTNTEHHAEDLRLPHRS